MTEPIVSVIMPVYNGDKYLRQSIESILNQTLSDFEFIIIAEYGTNVDSERILKEYNDKRLKVIYNSERLGLTKSLNIGLDKARGEYVARMDADDISLPSRFAKQVEFLNANKEIGICGTFQVIINEDGKEVYKQKLPTTHSEIHSDLLIYCNIKHSTVMFRRSLNLRYDESINASEDYELWCRAAESTLLANIPEYLLLYRWYSKSITTLGKKTTIQNYLNVMGRNFNKLGLHLSADELRQLCSMSAEYSFKSFRKYKKDIFKLKSRIIKANNNLCMYNPDALAITLNKRFCWEQHPFRQFVALVVRSAFGGHKQGSFLEQNGFIVTIKGMCLRNVK